MVWSWLGSTNLKCKGRVDWRPENFFKEPDYVHQEPLDLFPIEDHVDCLLQGLDLLLGVALLQVLLELHLIRGLEVGGDIDEGVARQLSRAHLGAATRPLQYISLERNM